MLNIVTKTRKRYCKRLKDKIYNNKENSKDWLKIYSLNEIIYFMNPK